MKRLKRTCIAIVLLGFATSASATLLTWNLQGTGPGGAVASGFLELDAALSSIGDFDIQLSGGGDPLFTDFEFTPSNSNVISASGSGVSLGTKQPTSTIDRFLSIAGSFSDAGGTVSISITDTRIQGDTEFPDNRSRTFAGIATTAVPEASSLSFLVLGILALLGLARQRKR